MTNYQGTWFSTFGPMTLNQEGSKVTGSYRLGEIQGTIQKDQLRFRYREAMQNGVGWFRQVRTGRFVGRWRPQGATSWQPWIGSRGFDGLWNSSFGRLRLYQENDHIHGHYEGLGTSQLEGRMDQGKFVFTYQEPQAKGQGWFVLAEDGMSFQGQWRSGPDPTPRPWVGQRILPHANHTCLLILEAPWQQTLAEREYSFGRMLGEFFSRLGNVQVRHRFFSDADSLLSWCREPLYLEEPIILVVASHGNPEGPQYRQETIPTPQIVKALQALDNLQLLHFSCCNIMKNPEELLARLPKKFPFPISGYSESVDWGGSAIFEMNYLDMMLSKSLAAEHAAKQGERLIRYSGIKPVSKSPYKPLGFHFIPAKP